MFWPTRMAVGGRLARSVASASCSGTPSASHLSAVRPVSGVRYDATGPSCRTSRWSLGAASPSTSAIEPTARSWCCTPDATHSTSIEKTGAPAGRETTTGGGASAGAAGAAACAGGAGGPLTETPSKAAVISAFRTDCAARFASFLRRFSSIILRTSSKAPSSAALTTTAGAAAGAGAGAAAAAVGGAVPGRTCEKRQASPFRQAPRAKKEQIGFAAVLTGFAAVPTGKTCEKRQASPLRQAPRAKKAQGGAVVMEDDRGARRRRAAAGGAAVCCWGGIRASSSSSSALRRSAAMESRTILSTSSLKESLYAVSRASSAATPSSGLAPPPAGKEACFARDTPRLPASALASASSSTDAAVAGPRPGAHPGTAAAARLLCEGRICAATASGSTVSSSMSSAVLAEAARSAWYARVERSCDESST
mmetsp:Transcript_37752/g.118441  ORF Transcript_37752/g.118441 Transcript_37752/m.118441 type:complete len:423 (-) Transcript_37752:307-1575(-)